MSDSAQNIGVGSIAVQGQAVWSQAAPRYVGYYWAVDQWGRIVHVTLEERQLPNFDTKLPSGKRLVARFDGQHTSELERFRLWTPVLPPPAPVEIGGIWVGPALLPTAPAQRTARVPAGRAAFDELERQP